MDAALYEELKNVARAGRTVTYRALAASLEADLDDPTTRQALQQALRRISTYEHAQGRPMLSAVVVMKDSRLPGNGFFDLARALGLHGHASDRDFHWQELRRVHAYWRQSGASTDLSGRFEQTAHS